MSANATNAIAAFFLAEGDERVVGGNTPVLLDDPGTMYYVDSGRLEIFSVAVEDGEPVGTRRHFFTAVPGDGLFGMDLVRDGEGQGFLAVGTVGTRLRRLPVAAFKARLADAGMRDGLIAMIERWVEGLSAGVARTIVPRPRADVQMEPGETVTLAAGRRARARHDVIWMRHDAGATLFIGMEELIGLADGALFPVTADTWVQALDGATLTAVASADALAGVGGWAGLEAFYGAVFRSEFFNTRLVAADELNRLRDKAVRDRAVHEASIDGLVSVLEPDRAAFADVPLDDPLLAAATLVGRAMRITITAPPKAKDGEVSTDPIGDILRASRVRSRVVMLKGDWWREEGWPLLARRAGSKRPVALIPARGGYDVHDPVEQTRTPVTEAVAATLEPQAHSFYRPLPDEPLGPLGLFRFGLQTAAADLRRPVIVGLAAGALAMLPPYVTGMLVDEIIPSAARGQLLQIALVLALVGLTTASFDIVRHLSIVRLESKMSATVQPAMWDRVLSLPITFFRRFAAGDLAQRVNAIEAIRAVLSGATLSALMTSLFSIFLLLQMFFYSWPLALLGFALVLVAMAVTMLAAYFKLRLQRAVMALDGRIAAIVLQLLSGISKIRVVGAESRAFAEWAREFARKKTLTLSAGMIDNRLATFSAMFPVLAAMAVFYFVTSWTEPGSLSPGAFVAFNAAFSSFLLQMLTLSNSVMSVLLVVPYYERAKPILDARPEIDTGKADPGDLSGEIVVDRVSFRYHPEGPLVLDDVSIRIGAGEYIAIVGPSGSGKSTLFRLLLGLDVPESGAIYYDGQNLAHLDVARTRRRIGVVMQTGRVRAGSLFDNIVGSAPLTMKDAMEAARMAGLEDDIKAMPMGMQTAVQQGGMTLSGGQRQRLMIARAIVNRPRILLFDEATSALDNRTQAIVTQSLQDLQATRVAIAHRLSTIIGADRIYVIDGGRVVQTGTYEELSAAPGLFAELIKRQLA